jgi:hypothetical protein
MSDEIKPTRKTRKFGHGGIPQPDDAAEKAAALAEFIAAGPDREKQRAVLIKFPFLAGPFWRAYAPDLLEEPTGEGK